MQEERKILYSAVQPTNNLTIGNYIGAVSNWVNLQSQYDCVFAIANMHAITVRQKKPPPSSAKTLSVFWPSISPAASTRKSAFYTSSPTCPPMPSLRGC